MAPVSTIDLHLHTTYSDGKSSPAELLRYAAEIGLEAVAICDHDNANGVRVALPAARKLGIELVPAVEFNCDWPGYKLASGFADIHVLGYFVDVDDPALQAFEQAAVKDFERRVGDCCAALQAAGYAVSLDEAFAENPHYAGLLHLMLVVQKKGYADDWAEAWRLVNTYWLQGRLSRFTVEQVIETVHRAGGVAVLAHPTLVRCSDDYLQAERLAQLVKMGLDGLEIYHPRLDEKARAHFLALANQFDLLVTGGSDEHGWFTGLKRMGSEPVTAEVLESLRTRHLERTRKTSHRALEGKDAG
jgi:hypothetical protein